MRTEIESMIADYLEGDLDEAAAERLASLLEADPQALEEFVGLAQQHRLLAQGPVGGAMTSADQEVFVRRVLASLPARRPRRSRRGAIAAAAALVGATVLAILYLNRPPEPLPTPTVSKTPPTPVAPELPPPPAAPEPPPAAAVPAPAVLQPPPPERAPGATFRLGVVNLRTCSQKEHYERIKVVDADLRRMADEYGKRLRDLEQKILEVRGRFDATPQESSLRAEYLLQLRRLETDLKFEKEYGRAKVLDYSSDRHVEVYNEIRRVVNLIAQEQKLDLVLRVEQPLLEEQDYETASQRINNRVVLFHHDSVDITPLVLKRLNDEWAKAQAAGSPTDWTCKECGRKSRGEACAATPGCKGMRPK